MSSNHNSTPESDFRKIKPIQTFYKGYHFRSRLEARWAVFFETIGAKWQYEVEGYEFDGIRYLPDFIIDDYLYVEIKPQSFASDDECMKFARFVRTKRRNLFLVCGEPGDCERDEDTWTITKKHPYRGQLFVGTFRSLDIITRGMFPTIERFWDLSDFLIERGYLSEDDPHDGGIESAYRLIELDKKYYQDKYQRPHPTWRYGISEDNLVFSQGSADWDTRLKLSPSYWAGGVRIAEAYDAARSARFEFGEVG